MTAEQIIEKATPNIQFKTARSSGAGGQHVNKVETKVILIWDIINDPSLEEQVRETLLQKLSTHINQEGVFSIYSQAKRTQLHNKHDVIRKWKNLLHQALKKPKPRKKTKPSKESIEKNKQQKMRRSDIKEMRKKPKI